LFPRSDAAEQLEDTLADLLKPRDLLLIREPPKPGVKLLVDRVVDARWLNNLHPSKAEAEPELRNAVEERHTSSCFGCLDYLGSAVQDPEVSPDFPERFGSIEDARAHCRVFFAWCNTEHRHSGIGLLTAHDVHHGLADKRVAARTHVLTAAHAAHPERFVGGVPRPPARPTAVWINPPPTATSRSNPAPARTEEDSDAFRAPDSHAAAAARSDLRTEDQQLSITQRPTAIANEADEPATTEAALH